MKSQIDNESKKISAELSKLRFHELHKETNINVSKLLISILLLISVVVSGIISFNLFYQFDYNTSAVLTIASYLSIVFCIYALTMGQNRPQVGYPKDHR